ncbi:MAG: FliA/WhiG family RNA polymerase sigma factor [Clostridiales bacterium]|nr:FliA/WhiG family RNA polymerase sigma factor [Clostridiales bacterium]
MEEQSLWHRYKKNNDQKSKNLLIEKYIELVKIIAGRLYNSYGTNVEYEDLVSYGIFGLLDAIEKFDIDKKVKFKTYASIRIRGAIIDQLRSLDWVPRSVRQKSKQLEETSRKLENELGRNPTDIEIAKELNISLKELSNMLQQVNSFNIISLEETIYEYNTIDHLEYEEENSPENILSNKEIYETLEYNIENLPERERQVISLYYYDELTYKEIGQILNVSESRVSQLHSKAINKLKSKLQPYDK